MASNSFGRANRMNDAKYYSHFATSISMPVSKRQYAWVPKTVTHSADMIEGQTPCASPMTRMSSVSTTFSDSPRQVCPCQDELSSTDASDDDLPISCDLTSSDSEHDEDYDIIVQSSVYSVRTLLKYRSLACDSEGPGSVRYGSRPTSDHREIQGRISSKSSSSWRSSEGTNSQRLPHDLAESSMAQQRKSTSDVDAKILRVARSILNKLTIEKFEPLLAQLTSCGITQPHHISMLMHEIFEKATIQHNFIPMYADLCMRLEKDPTISDAVKEAGEMHNFRRLLLNQCQLVFEQVLEPIDIEADNGDADEEVSFRRKQRALGNMKLIGQLLAHGMLSSDLFVQCCEELLCNRSRCSEALEALVALMMVAGPAFDKKSWQFLSRLEKIIADMTALTMDKKTPPRLRFLIRDTLDARDAGWPSSPKTATHQVSDERQTDALHDGGKHAVHPWRKVAVKKMEPPSASRQKFDVVAFRRTLATVLSDLASDKNIPAAVQNIRMQEVPLALQADQFVDILTRVAEERRGAVRRTQLAFIAGLVVAESSAFDRNECLSGVRQFFQDTYDDLCKEVYRLPGIMKSEFVPTMMTVMPAADINSVVPASMRR